jgi:hypothetical protein
LGRLLIAGYSKEMMNLAGSRPGSPSGSPMNSPRSSKANNSVKGVAVKFVKLVTAFIHNKYKNSYNWINYNELERSITPELITEENVGKGTVLSNDIFLRNGANPNDMESYLLNNLEHQVYYTFEGGQVKESSFKEEFVQKALKKNYTFAYHIKDITGGRKKFGKTRKAKRSTRRR